MRNRVLVATDWLKVKLFGRYAADVLQLLYLTNGVSSDLVRD
jgi:hypothetical protein